LLNGLFQNFLLGRLGYFFIFLNHRDIFYLKELFKKTNSAAMAASRKEQRPNSSKWAGPVPRTRTGGHLDRSPSGDDDARMIDRTGELSLAAAACHPSRHARHPRPAPGCKFARPRCFCHRHPHRIAESTPGCTAEEVGVAVRHHPPSAGGCTPPDVRGPQVCDNAVSSSPVCVEIVPFLKL
jgi:hypothetical protein